jgi:pyridoxal phosphate enzyme (YggS family)
MTSIADRVARVRERIEDAARRAGRDPARIELLAVTKTRTAEEMAAVVRAGVTRLGENYVQEARRKAAELRRLAADLVPHWHLIGALQTNKAKLVPGFFDVVESVDRAELAQALARRAAAAAATRLAVLVQVNVGREPQKAGCDPERVEALLEQIARLPSLEPRGLMAIPPDADDPEDARPFFRRLAREGSRLTACRLLPDPPVLSMGMSHDFTVAIEEGATRVRIGTALFGPRSGAGPVPPEAP